MVSARERDSSKRQVSGHSCQMWQPLWIFKVNFLHQTHTAVRNHQKIAVKEGRKGTMLNQTTVAVEFFKSSTTSHVAGSPHYLLCGGVRQCVQCSSPAIFKPMAPLSLSAELRFSVGVMDMQIGLNVSTRPSKGKYLHPHSQRWASWYRQQRALLCLHTCVN